MLVSGMVLHFLCFTAKKPKQDIHLKTRRRSDALWWAEMESGEGTGFLLSSSHQSAPASARQERELTKLLGALETCLDCEEPATKLNGQREQRVHAGHKRDSSF